LIPRRIYLGKYTSDVHLTSDDASCVLAQSFPRTAYCLNLTCLYLIITLPGGNPPTVVPEADVVLQPRMKGRIRFNPKPHALQCFAVTEPIPREIHWSVPHAILLFRSIRRDLGRQPLDFCIFTDFGQRTLFTCPIRHFLVHDSQSTRVLSTTRPTSAEIPRSRRFALQ
jgi:hypothetical protein